MENKILFIGFELGSNRKEAVSINFKNHLKYVVSKDDEVYTFGLSSKIGVFKHLLNLNKYVKQIFLIIRSKKITHVHDMFVLPLITLLFLIPIKFKFKQIVLIKELHNNFGFSKKINFETILRFFMSSKVLVYLVLKLVDTMYSRSRYISNYWKIKYVPQYVYIKPLNTRLDKNINRICYLGHPMRKKGVYLFPELLTRLKNTNRDDVSFSFALSNLGDRPKITKQISEAAYGSDIKVSFLNEVEPSRFFRDNSIFILPSVDEHSATSVPNTILESMEAGCVVITSKNNITSGVIKNGYSGILLDKMDSESLLLSINSLVSSKKAYSKISSNSRKYVEVNHDLRYIRKCFKKIYDK